MSSKSITGVPGLPYCQQSCRYRGRTYYEIHASRETPAFACVKSLGRGERIEREGQDFRGQCDGVSIFIFGFETAALLGFEGRGGLEKVAVVVGNGH